jgi:cholesterol transport system auxiliary component
MTTTKHFSAGPRPALAVAVLACAGLVAGCSALTQATAPTPPTFYSLDGGPRTVAATSRPASSPAANGTYTLVVNDTQAAAGYDSQRIIYVRQPHKLEYFAHSEWVDPPSRMISSLVVGALEKSGVFRAVVSAPGSASGELRLETEVVLLQHEFTVKPSQVRFVLRAYIAEDGTRRVLATRDLEAVVPSSSEDPYGGVIAANAAVKQVLDDLTAFCAQTVASWQPRKPAAR